MLPVGFTFVNLVNLRNERKNPFLDCHLSYKSFLLTVTVIAPLFFFVSAIVTLRGQHDLDGYCTSDFMPKQQETVLTGDAFLDSLPSDETPSCKTYTLQEVFKYNYMVWTLGYFIGLQFTHMDQGIMQQFVLDWNVMKNWPPVLWAVFFAMIAFLGAFADILGTFYH